MNALYRLEDAILGPVGRVLESGTMPILARLVFLATLAPFFWSSAMTKPGGGHRRHLLAVGRRLCADPARADGGRRL